MIKFIFVCVALISPMANAALITAPDGVQIGADVNGRLPIYDSDSWADSLPIGELAAGEVKVVEITNVVNVRAGDDYICRQTDPNNQYEHPEALLIMGCWTASESSIKVRVKNVGTETLDFGSPQFQFLHFNTSAPQ